MNTDPISFLRRDYPQAFFFAPVTPDTVNDVIQSLKNKTSNINDLLVKVFKIISPIIDESQSIIIKKSFTSAHFPNDMKIARVVPISK